MKKPGSLRAIQVITWITIGLAVLFFSITSFLLLFEGAPDSGYSEFRKGFVVEGMGVGLNYTWEVFLGTIWPNLFHLLKFSLVLFFIHKKWFKALFAALVVIPIISFVEFLYSYRSLFSMVYPLSLLIIFLLNFKKIKEYMSQKAEAKTPTNEIEVSQ